MNRTLLIPFAAFAFTACSSETTPTETRDAGVNDAGVARDAGPDGCGTIAFSPIALDDPQDVQTIYSARLTTELGGPGPDHLVFNFVNYNERFGPMAVGTFSLADAPNDNRGTCPECISVFEDQATAQSEPAVVFFQSAGSIRLDVDPRTQVFRGRVEGLELVEVTIDPVTLESTPVPNGRCLRADDFDVDYAYVPPEWTCDASLYRSGGICNCDCGAPDPDCYCDPFMNPNCPDPIENDCPMGSVCTPNGCQVSCDPFSTPPVACMPNELCAFTDDGPACGSPADRTNPAALGAECMNLGNLIQYCAVSNTVPAGVCDDIDNLCRPICGPTAPCPQGEQCYTFVGGGLEGYGYCRPEGDVTPPKWECDPDDYADGTACHCNCGAQDPDCANDELPIFGCAEGEICAFGMCE